MWDKYCCSYFQKQRARLRTHPRSVVMSGSPRSNPGTRMTEPCLSWPAGAPSYKQRLWKVLPLSNLILGRVLKYCSKQNIARQYFFSPYVCNKCSPRLKRPSAILSLSKTSNKKCHNLNKIAVFQKENKFRLS